MPVEWMNEWMNELEWWQWIWFVITVYIYSIYFLVGKHWYPVNLRPWAPGGMGWSSLSLARKKETNDHWTQQIACNINIAMCLDLVTSSSG
jgi:hypothetical protein